MNDFTKEELIAIRENLSAGDTPEENSMIYRCYEKIQSMIDNYCEHFWSCVNCSPYDHINCKECNRYMYE